MASGSTKRPLIEFDLAPIPASRIRTGASLERRDIAAEWSSPGLNRTASPAPEFRVWDDRDSEVGRVQPSAVVRAVKKGVAQVAGAESALRQQSTESQYNEAEHYKWLETHRNGVPWLERGQDVWSRIIDLRADGRGFCVHEAFIRRYSTRIDQEWLGLQGGAEEHGWLSDYSGTAVSNFIMWLYQQSLCVPESGLDCTLHKCANPCWPVDDLLSLYGIASDYRVRELSNDVVTELVMRNVLHGWSDTFDTIKGLQDEVRDTKLTACLIAALVYEGRPEEQKAVEAAWSRGKRREKPWLMIKLMDTMRERVDEVPHFQRRLCDFHEHDSELERRVCRAYVQDRMTIVEARKPKGP